MRFSLFLILIPVLAFATIKVDYHFEFSQLIVHIEGESKEYLVDLDGATYTTQGDLRVPWSKGKMGVLKVTPLGTSVGIEVKIDAVHDNPPVINLDIPEVLGLGLWRFYIDVVDDWDRRDELGIRFSIDGGEEISGNVVKIDTFFMNDGKHTLNVSVSDSFGNVSSRTLTFKVDTTPPDPPKYEFRNPDMVVFPGKPNLMVLNVKSGYFERVSDVDVLKREVPLVVGKLDDAGNVSRFVVIEPFPGTLVPISTRGPLTSIMEDLLLLGSGAPYTVLGKTILPEDRTLVLGSGANLMISPTGELQIKGLFMNISPKVKVFGNGSLTLAEGARVFLEDVDVETSFEIHGGKMIYLKEVGGFSKLVVSNVEYLILENMNLDSLEVSNTLNVIVYNSRISKLVIDGAKEVRGEGSNFEIVQIYNFTRCDFRGVDMGSLALDVFSRIDCVKCDIDSLVVTKGSRGRFRESTLGKVSVRNFSSLEMFKTNVKGDVKVNRSELIMKRCHVGGEISENGAIVQEW